MVRALPDILARIVDQKRSALAGLATGRDELERRAERSVAGRRDFRAALESRTPAIIAEIKRASPSKGLFADQFEPAGIARAYERGGAAAISVLTDEPFFRGSLADLEAARSAVRIPALRKDFTIDEFHVVEAAAHGADAILLIAAILSEVDLRRFREAGARYGMAAVIEVHDENELALALGSGAEIVGVNNRDLHSFAATLDTSLRLADRIPDGILKVSESGIRTVEDVRRLRAAGYQALLVGEHLMRSADPARALETLLA